MRKVLCLAASMSVALAHLCLANEESTAKDLVAKALEARGKEYFAAKSEIVARRDAAAVGKQLIEDQEISWQKVLLGHSIMEALEPSKSNESSMSPSQTFGEIVRFISKYPFDSSNEQARLIYSGDPRLIPKQNPVGELFHKGSSQVGLLAEILFKHTEETWADFCAREISSQINASIPQLLKEEKAELAKTPEEAAKTGRRRISVPARTTPEEILKEISPQRRALLLRQARVVAARMLVLAKADEAVLLLKELASRQNDHGLAVECLACIGNEAAVKALREMEEKSDAAKNAIKRIEKEKSQTTRPATSSQPA